MTKDHLREKDVKAKIKKLLTYHGWFWFSPAANAFGINGVSDTLALKDGKLLAIEVKLKKEDGSRLQEIFMQNVRDHGGYARVVNMAQVESGEFERWLAELS